MKTFVEAETMMKHNPIDDPPAGFKIGKLKDATALNVRQHPRADAEVVFILKEDSPFRFTTTDDPNWYKIGSPTTVTAGFAMSKYIAEVEGDAT